MDGKQKCKLVSVGKANDCSFCDKKNVPYKCSQCELPYCSSDCFKCLKHFQCSENFFKKSVLSHLKSTRSSDEEKKDFCDKLKQTSKKINAFDYADIWNGDDEFEFVDMDDDEDNFVEDEDWENLFPRNPNEVDDFLTKVTPPESEKPVDAENLWFKLSIEQKEEFVKIVKKNRPFLESLITLWKPWWLENDWQQLVSSADVSSKYPKLYTNFKSDGNTPSPSTGTAILCSLLAYCYISRLYNGEISCCAHFSKTLHDCEQWPLDIFNVLVKVCGYFDPKNPIVADITPLNAVNITIARILTAKFESTDFFENLRDKKTQICQLLDDVHTLIDYVGEPKRTLIVVSSPDVKLYAPKGVVYALSDLIYIIKRIQNCLSHNIDLANLNELQIEQMESVCKLLITYLNYSIEHSDCFKHDQPTYLAALDCNKAKFLQENNLFEMEDTEDDPTKSVHKTNNCKLIEEIN